MQKRFDKREREFLRNVAGDENRRDFERLETYDHMERLESKGAIIGVAGIVKRYSLFLSLFLAVGREFRGMGYGQKLMAQLLENYKRRPIFLTLYRNNEKAFHIYKKYGFIRLFSWRRKKLLMVRF